MNSILNELFLPELSNLIEGYTEKRWETAFDYVIHGINWGCSTFFAFEDPEIFNFYPQIFILDYENVLGELECSFEQRPAFNSFRVKRWFVYGGLR